jgi:hypothetical protein
MTELRMYMNDEKVGSTFKKSIAKRGDEVREAMRGAASDAAVEIEARGEADIEAGGNFGERWSDALSADVTEGGGNIRISVGFKSTDPTVDVAWPVFEYGATIKGKPLLFIPLPGVPSGLWAKDYPDPLFRTVRKSDGLVLLGSTVDGKMKYFGKEQVTIPQKWHLREIVRKVAGEMRELVRDRFKG